MFASNEINYEAISALRARFNFFPHDKKGTFGFVTNIDLAFIGDGLQNILKRKKSQCKIILF